MNLIADVAEVGDRVVVVDGEVDVRAERIRERRADEDLPLRRADGRDPRAPQAPFDLTLDPVPRFRRTAYRARNEM